MNTRKEQIEAIFGAAIELSSPEQRAVYLAKVCGDDSGLRREIEELLQAYDKAGGFLTASSAHAEAVPRSEASSATVLLPITEKPGDHIGRYKLLQQIGEGGCGVVYMAEQEEPVRRRVALKVIKLGMYPRQPTSWRLIDYPSSYHNGAGGLNFADGHSEIRRWRDRRTNPPHKSDYHLFLYNPGVPCAGNQDVLWLMERATGKK